MGVKDGTPETIGVGFDDGLLEASAGISTFVPIPPSVGNG